MQSFEKTESLRPSQTQYCAILVISCYNLNLLRIRMPKPFCPYNFKIQHKNTELPSKMPLNPEKNYSRRLQITKPN